jgi:1-acyl-sn-glycerol-3-phosphate acyltransferase
MIRPIRFVWKTLTKSFIYFLFVSGSLFLVTAVFPLIMLFVHPADRCSKAMRRATHHIFFLMNFVTWALGLIHVDISREDLKKLRSLKSAIIVANHPSLLDITLLMGMIPHADCIVNAALFDKFIVRHVVRRLFVPNSLDFNEMLDSCNKSLKAGNCLVIFPEGTRTKVGIKPVIRKGSARIALGTECPVYPIHIEANDMRGLRKGDPFYRINKKGRYRYRFILQDPILPESYQSMPLPIAARKMNEEIYTCLFPAS